MSRIFQQNSYLTPDALVNLKSYKYRSVDKSYLSYYVLNPYWTWCAQFMPSWLAPNVITLIGIIAIYFNVVCVEIYMPDLIGPGPSWVYYSFAAGLWFYQTMDNIDGKQARKTGSSSPLGELFDHGIDSLNCCLGGLVNSACVGLGSSYDSCILTFITCLAMYFSTWETYHTHTLFLGYMNGPTEGIVIAVLVMIVSGYYGPQAWSLTVAEVAPASWIVNLIGDYRLVDLWIFSAVISVLIFHIPFCILNVYLAKRERKESFLDTVPEWLPIGVLTVTTVSWIMSPFSTIISENHLVLFALTLSFVFGRVTTKIILAHLTRQPFPYWSLPIVPLITGSLLFAGLPRIGFVLPAPVELYYLWAFFLFSLVYYLNYARVVINSLCNYLGINCFTIKKPAKIS